MAKKRNRISRFFFENKDLKEKQNITFSETKEILKEETN